MREAIEQGEWMRVALHDLSQPLTALECRLFLATMGGEPRLEEMREAIAEGLVECERMMTLVRGMQERLR